MRLLVVGDTHSEASSWTSVVRPAIAAERPDAVLSVGDFGYWPDHPEGRRFLDEVEGSIGPSGIEVWFVDGNHEQHDRLEPGAVPVAVGRGINHLPRGARWCWEGVDFGALGGAVSPDRDDRVEGWDWFASEAICEADVERLGGAPLDVLVTHDAPSWCRLEGTPAVRASVDRDTQRNRVFVDRAVQATRPALVLHGHWHRAHHVPADATRDRPAVVGLGAEGGPASALLALLEITTTGAGADRGVIWSVEPISSNEPATYPEEKR